jgi:hypothetical protein
VIGVKLLLTIIAILIIITTSVCADIVYFTDGMKTVCQEKAWEENEEVKCEYQGVVLSYKKSDVLRIELRRSEKKESNQSSPQLPASSPQLQTKTGPKRAVDKVKPSDKAASSSGTGNLVFYDPRRKQKYWTSKTSRHATLEEAFAALASQYDRTPQWIQANMGETNDLEEIHQNLAKQKLEADTDVGQAKQETTGAIKFYNPRRVYKYWTGESSKHKSLDAALEALAQQYDRSVQWVRAYIGETNDLNEIHQNLHNRKLVETAQ